MTEATCVLCMMWEGRPDNRPPDPHAALIIGFALGMCPSSYPLLCETDRTLVRAMMAELAVDWSK